MPSVSKAPKWDVHRLPRAEGRSVLVTGGNAGIGYFVAEQLAGTGATIVLGSRDAAKAGAAIASIGSRVPGAKVMYVPMDLADPASLEAAVDELGLDRLDAVVHNAGKAIVLRGELATSYSFFARGPRPDTIVQAVGRPTLAGHPGRR
ncbi:SDR family NAD(P)-dependent oxidoreductase [Kitasatospora griseola]|uniref:SDR family NAD(P)-dependent oxidoreductase n=1 Tax=Kitasatospora griseola TaxID=2064 RepID=UPI0034360913